ncbi:hypothetical protein RZS08_54405, partial [Arthrospira platensis SPKY1]|nr:hypothetical protein [Arthrospira platensis SPKY1]
MITQRAVEQTGQNLRLALDDIRLGLLEHSVGELGMKSEFDGNPLREFDHDAAALARGIDELKGGVIGLTDEYDGRVGLQVGAFLGAEVYRCGGMARRAD